ncbi:unnamed protein product [Penicillium glandicola]
MDFSEIDPDQSHPTDLEVTEYFGPRILTGERRERKISTNTCFYPKVGTPLGLSAEVGGLSRNTEVCHASRWKFTGTRLAAETPSNSQTRHSSCRQLVWHLEENKLEQQAFHQPTFHSAVAFNHDSQPFYLDIKIEAKMQRWRDRFKQSIVYPPRNRKSYTKALIEPKKEIETSESFRNTILNLEQTMVERNLHPVPEISDPKPAGPNRATINYEDSSEYALEFTPSKSLSALVGDMIGQKRPILESEDSSISVNSNDSNATLVEPVEVDQTADQNKPTPSIKDDNSATPTDSPIASPLPDSGKHLDHAYSDHAIVFEFSVFSFFGYIPRFLAALVTYLIMGLNGLHAVLAKAGSHA